MPAAVRDHFNLKAGDIVDFYVDDAEGSVRLLVRNKSISERLEELKLPPPPNGRPVTVAEMDEAIGEYLAEKHERISREWDERHEFEEWKRTRDKRAGS
jgi:bifunctional DNA-binding transcriptional regulator/antitoxin component of YhaV-PrlF toxin-antitoxin module